MSRLAGFLVVVLASVAVADSSEPPAAPAKTTEPSAAARSSKFPLRVVKILADAEQALLFDDNRGRYVLVDVGDEVGDYTVAAIRVDEVTLAGKDVPVEIALASPDAKPARKDVADRAPADPYADASEAKPTTAPAIPADPYADEPAPTTRSAAAADGDGDKVTASPLANADVPKPSPEVAKRGADDGANAIADAMTAAAKQPAAGTLARKDVTAALADFGALASSIDAAFTAKGVAIAKIKPGSIFAKAGFLAGDVITAVDGKPLRTLDDAAELYARADVMKSATVQVVRGGKPLTLRIAIQ